MKKSLCVIEKSNNMSAADPLYTTPYLFMEKSFSMNQAINEVTYFLPQALLIKPAVQQICRPAPLTLRGGAPCIQKKKKEEKEYDCYAKIKRFEDNPI